MRYIKGLTKDTLKLLKRIYQQSKYYQVRQRAHCIQLSYQGYKISELMEIFHVSRNTIYNWFNAWESSKFSGLYNSSGRGRKKLFTVEQEQQIKNWITVTVQANSNEELIATTIEEDTLTLDFAEDRSGTAEITLRAIANGQTIDDTFTITVEPIDRPPTVDNPIADLTVSTNEENQTIDLSEVFEDADGDEITVTVQANSNEELVATTIEENALSLDFEENQTVLEFRILIE